MIRRTIVSIIVALAVLSAESQASWASECSLPQVQVGLIHARFRQFQDALADFDRTVEINPTGGDALRMRARMHRELDQSDLAFDDMIHAVAFSETVLKQTMPGLRTAGYWRSSEAPAALTSDFKDAIRACMLDKLCN